MPIDQRHTAHHRDPIAGQDVEFTFDSAGAVQSVFVPDRPHDVGGRTEPTPWRGRWWSHVERSGKIQPGYDGDLVVRNWLVTSDDDGLTWSKPRDVTRDTKREKGVTTVAGGPLSKNVIAA